jgi:hypothetical protein
MIKKEIYNYLVKFLFLNTLTTVYNLSTFDKIKKAEFL